MRRLLVLGLVLLLAGCVEKTSPVDVEPYYVINDAQPGRATEFAFFLRSTSPFKQTLDVSFDGPDGWTFEAENDSVELRGKDTSSLVVRVTPDANATHEPREVTLHVGDTKSRVIVNVRDLGREPLRAGIGTQVYYVLWYANGTLASTNDPALRARATLGNAILDDANDTSGDVPLKVYVGGERGTPPPEPYNSTGYHPVIEGFDARLQDAGDGSGMVAGETLAVRVPKDKAYTIAGNEDHVLYGEDLTFLVRVVTVDILVARSCDLPVCPVTG
ncbi:MAG TPA: hypothetical protein VM370_08810 [Candidatus Thermoplasmatota archaeon]|nr:hypothetical protein [Candidatus Thermoplasmatota archaeon]